MSKIKKIMLQASGVQLTIEKNSEDTVFVSVGQDLINQVEPISNVHLRHFVAQDIYTTDSYSMFMDTMNYKLTFENLKEISEFLERKIEKVTF